MLAGKNGPYHAAVVLDDQQEKIVMGLGIAFPS
jgi:hypothetical protein